MKILAIESSCDETSAAVVEKKGNSINVLSNITATSLAIHAGTGGIIPENAAREQVKYIIPVITQALNEFGKNENQNWESARDILKENIDAIAVTHGPGLIGSLLVGVETAKTLSFALKKPLIPVNHLLAHLFANFIQPAVSSQQSAAISFPLIGLIVSGGHTDLLLFESVSKFKWLGGTRDDAAGEALDKIGRLLGLPYPAGAEIERRALLFANPRGSDTIQPRGLRRYATLGKPLQFHSPLIGESTFDFSFSGLKTEAQRFIQNNPGVHLGGVQENRVNEVCFAVQKAIIDVLVKKTLQAAEKFGTQTILLGGGVSANQTLREAFELKSKDQKLKTNIFAPEKIYCTDNAAMIGAYALLHPEPIAWKHITAMPELYFSEPENKS